MARFTHLALLLFTLFSCRQSTVDLYVAPGGNDGNTGQLNAPLQTLERALALVETQKTKTPDIPINIWLREGTHYLQQALVFKAIHSGTAKHPLKVAAYAGEVVVLSGATSYLPQWEKTDGPLWKASLNTEQPFDQLFIEGEKQILARNPNYDPDVLIYNGYAADVISPERIRTWSHPETGILHAMHRAEWGDYHYQISGVDDQGEAILTGGYQNNRQMGMHPEYRFVENIREELDAPREWYYDREEHMLYYYPEKGFDPTGKTIEVALLPHLLEFQGTESEPVHDILIEGITLQHTRSTYMETREPLLRSDWAIYRGGAILLQGSENIQIKNNHFQHLGGNALFVNRYNRNTVIAENHLEQIGASAICLVGSPEAVRSPSFEYHEWVPFAELDRTPGPKSKDYPTQAIIQNNLIHDIGNLEKQVAGVQISMASEITLSHNTIYNTPRAGINISEGTWGGHLIEYNDVFNTVLETGDHGAFNSWGRDRFWHPNRGTMDSITRVEPSLILLDAQKTTIIRNNRFRCDHGWDIDLDDGSSNYHIYNNLCLNGGLKLREGFHRTVENNIMVNNSFHPHVWFEDSHDVFRHNIVMTWYKPIRLNGWGDEIDYNLLPDSAALKRSQELGLDAHSQFGNPQFLDPAAGDFRVADGSPALKVGFENFAMDSFGVTATHLQALAAGPEITPPLFDDTAGGENPVIDFLGAKVSNVQGLGERSAAGLDSEKGVMIRETEEDSPAESSGLRPGDVIVALNENPVDNVKQLIEHFQGERWRGRIQLDIIRDQKRRQITIKL